MGIRKRFGASTSGICHSSDRQAWVNVSPNYNPAITTPDPETQLSCSNGGSISIQDYTSAAGIKQLVDVF